MRIAAAVALVVLAGACGPAVPNLPSQGGPAWLELQSEHFTLWTDADEVRGRELMHEIEELRQVVIGVAFRGAPGAGRGFVIALRDDGELHAYVPETFSAMTIGAGNTPIRQPMIVLSAASNVSDSKIVEAHELTHLISRAVIHQQPHWFAEGLARYFETVKIDERDGTVDVGTPPERRIGNGSHVEHRLIPLDQLLACRTAKCLDAGFYATAWALFTYLTNARPDDLARLEAHMEELHTDDNRRAWDDVFGADSLPAMTEQMRQWLVTGSHTVFHFKISLAAHAVAVRTLGDGDVFAIRALLRTQFSRDKVAIAGEVDAALAADRTNVLARIVDATLDRPHDLAATRATAAAHPDDWRAWWLLSRMLPGGDTDPEVVDARQKACTRAQENPMLLVPAELRCLPAAPAR